MTDHIGSKHVQSDRRNFLRVTSDAPAKRYSPSKQETSICLVTVHSTEACQASAQDKGKQPLHLVRRPGLEDEDEYGLLLDN